ncbi:MAG TPA: glycosyl hydrolase-related protein [Caldilineaceae bacterium]|nr:glycosyl hydrolase-related protein [Caldilineaceae bacterium]
MAGVETLYLIHHSHTDIGYTHDQPVVFELHDRFISQAMALAERSLESRRDGAFRWTVENTYVLSQWLARATPAQIERFQALERAGRIEVTAMFANLTPLFDIDQLIESFQLLRRLRQDYGFTITSAMNCDVNGEPWPLVDLLLDLGIEGFTMAINTHFGGAPLHRPDVFWWQGPSGRAILAYNGWPYDQGWRLGLGRSADDFANVWWPRVAQRLKETGYRLPCVMVQSYHPFGDNGSAFEGFVQWIDEWNERGQPPHIRFATPREWWAAVKQHLDLLETYRGDWTDYWNFGCASSAREQSINRQSRVRLRTADAVGATLLAAGYEEADPWLARSFRRYREPAWDQLHLWDEHTWGADISIRRPYGEDTASQWHHKAGFAYAARSLSLLLQRDAAAALARLVQPAAPDDLLLVNPLPWPRTLVADVPPWLLTPRGVADDTTAGRLFQDRQPRASGFPMLDSGQPEETRETRTTTPPVTVPPFGYVVVPRKALVSYSLADQVSEEAVVETDRYRLGFDCERGGLVSLYDKRLGHEWVDQEWVGREQGYRFNGFVHEEVADREHAWPRHRLFFMEWRSEQLERPRGWRTGWRARRRTPTAVRRHQVFRTPLGIEVVQLLDAPGVAGPLMQSVFLPNFAEYVECRAWWPMGLDDHPEATYLLYPFHLPGAMVRLDLGPQALQPEVEQLPGVCRDYFTVQNWVDFSNGELGVTIATPENPMVQLGDFHFGHNQSEIRLERPLLLGWVTNNYWETNFRAHQPGRVTARYRIQPYAGPFDEAQAHRFGLEAMADAPLLQHMGEAREQAVWPESGTLLELPEPPVMALHVKAAAQGGGLIVRLLNASDETQTARIGSGLVRIRQAAVCSLLEEVGAALPVSAGAVTLALEPRRVAVVHLAVEGA